MDGCLLLYAEPIVLADCTRPLRDEVECAATSASISAAAGDSTEVVSRITGGWRAAQPPEHTRVPST
jgi:hypothetical protein